MSSISLCVSLVLVLLLSLALPSGPRLPPSEETRREPGATALPWAVTGSVMSSLFTSRSARLLLGINSKSIPMSVFKWLLILFRRCCCNRGCGISV